VEPEAWKIVANGDTTKTALGYIFRSDDGLFIDWGDGWEDGWEDAVPLIFFPDASMRGHAERIDGLPDGVEPPAAESVAG
jgi:hypothetical protein